MDNLKTYLGEALYTEVKEALKGKGKDGKDILLAVANDGSFLPKAKFDTLYKEYRDVKEAYLQKQQEFASLEQMQEENATLKQQIAKEQEEKDAALSQYQSQLEGIKKDTVLEKTLSAEKARNHKAVNALVDWDQVTYENDTFMGLTEQLSKIKTDAPYLFESAGESFAYAPKGGSVAPDYTVMSDADYYKLMNKKG